MLYYFYFGLSEIKVKTIAFFELLSPRQSDYKTVAIPLNKFDTKNSDEIWVDGNLYDIASYKISGDSVYVSLLQDKKEEVLIKNNTEHFNEYTSFTGVSGGKQIHKKNSIITDDWKICNSKKLIYFVSPSYTSYCLHNATIARKYYVQVITPPPNLYI